MPKINETQRDYRNSYRKFTPHNLENGKDFNYFNTNHKMKMLPLSLWVLLGIWAVAISLQV